jgi:hypothetical protein
VAPNSVEDYAVTVMAQRFVFWSLPHRAYLAAPLVLFLAAHGVWIARGGTERDLPIFIAFGTAAIVLYVALVRVTLEVRPQGLRLARFFGQRWIPLEGLRSAALDGSSLRLEMLSGEVIGIRGDHWINRELARRDRRFSVLAAHKAVSAALVGPTKGTRALAAPDL